MNIETLIDQMNLTETWIFKSELGCFIRKYLTSKIACPYKLFYGYVFQYHRIEAISMQNEFNNYVLTKDKKHIDLRHSYNKKYFLQHNLSYFIGYNQKEQPIFLHVTKSKHQYFYCGFLIDTSRTEPQYAYLVEDSKIFAKLKNLPILDFKKSTYNNIKKEWEYDPLYTMILEMTKSKTTKLP